MVIDQSLRYVSTQDIRNVVADGSMTVESAQGCDLGRLDGFMVDPVDRSLRYYVVTRFAEFGAKMGLVPFVPGCLDAEHGVLRLLDEATLQPLG